MGFSKLTIAGALLLCSLQISAKNLPQDFDVKRMEADIQRIKNQVENTAPLQRDTIDLPVFKQLQLPNLFGIPGYSHLKFPIYKSTGKKGPGILLVHGNSSSSRSFVYQVLSLLGKQYKIFLLDLPGFGQSEKMPANLPLPTDPGTGIPLGFPEYSLGLIEAVATAAADPQINPKIFVGWSLGGDVLLFAKGLGLLPNAKGLFLVGTAPQGANAPSSHFPAQAPYVPGFEAAGFSTLLSYGFGFKLNAQSPFGFSLDGQFTDPVEPGTPAPISQAPNVGTAYLRAFFNEQQRLSDYLPPFFVEDGFQRADARTRQSIGAAFLFPTPGILPDELQVLQGLAGDPQNPADDIPIALMIGGDDAFFDRQYVLDLAAHGAVPTLWNNQVIVVPEAGHAVHFDRPVVFNLKLRQFIDDIH
ncbi:MAG: hypothetical protein COT73_11625 [Bdellovibrio sp. CG10_big_fil_rev_8_21_14_0_10_47_8]|nr:MAG: hypothetical protein COT73_11625 [Bdellovibrio sp. CG10_big_fil_rev_8_21_14_0_10_47_8]